MLPGNRKEALTIFCDNPLLEVKSLIELNPFPIIILDSQVKVLGILDEMLFWKSVDTHGWESPIGTAVHRNLVLIQDEEEIESELTEKYDYIVHAFENSYWIYDSSELKQYLYKQKVDQIIKLNNMYQEELELSRKKNKELKRILDSSYDEIFVTDADGNILFISESCKKFTGLPPEAFLGKSVSDLMEKGILRNSVTLKVIETKSTTSAQQVYPTGRTVVATAKPIFDENGNLHRIVTNSRDVTELEELRNKVAMANSAKNKLKNLNSTPIASILGKLVTRSEKMLPIIDLIETVAPTDSSILIEGESGVGKGVLAEIIHGLSPRKDKNMVTVNCGAIPTPLIESELFGYEAGSFTGASKEGKVGLVEQADGGTLFLDEIGELPLDVQVKLLHLVQEKSFKRVGGTQQKKVDIRIISATNKILKKMIEEKCFREDLFYRLHVVPIKVPSVEERREDIPLLVDHFLKRFNTKYSQSINLSEGAYLILQSYHWPGNVRELENLIEQVVVTAKKPMVYSNDLPQHIKQLGINGTNSDMHKSKIRPLKHAVEETEKRLLEQALLEYKTSRKMAKALGVNQTTIIRKLHKYKLGVESQQVDKDIHSH